MISNNNNNSSNFCVDKEEKIQVTLSLKKNIYTLGRLISYQYNKSFDEFVSEELRQAILSIGPIT